MKKICLILLILISVLTSCNMVDYPITLYATKTDIEFNVSEVKITKENNGDIIDTYVANTSPYSNEISIAGEAQPELHLHAIEDTGYVKIRFQSKINDKYYTPYTYYIETPSLEYIFSSGGSKCLSDNGIKPIDE